MEYRFTVLGKMAGLNEYTSANRTNPYVGAKMKKDAQRQCASAIRLHIGALKISKPVEIEYHFYEENRRRDHDNVEAFAHKVIQDALVVCGVLVDDGWNEIVGDTNVFSVDRHNPRVEVVIREVEK